MVDECIDASNSDSKNINASDKGVLEAFVRGLLTDEQAMSLLQIEDYSKLHLKVEHLNLRDSKNRSESNSVADGFANYWLSQNSELEP